jgi:hypothetical protein
VSFSREREEKKRKREGEKRKREGEEEKENENGEWSREWREDISTPWQSTLEGIAPRMNRHELVVFGSHTTLT